MADGLDSTAITVVETTWDRIRADVLSHLFTGALLVLVARVPLPRVGSLTVDPATLLKDPWLELAGKLGLSWLAPVAVAVVIFGYLFAMRAIGNFMLQLAGIVVFAMFPRWQGLVSNEFVRWESLVTIAGTFRDDTYTANDLMVRFMSLQNKYLLLNKGELERVSQRVQAARSARTYAVNSVAFLAIWITLFLFAPSGWRWIAAARPQFWAAALLLFVLFAWAYYRLWSATPALVGAQATAVAACIWDDKEFDDARPDAVRRNAIRDRLIALESSESENAKAFRHMFVFERVSNARRALVSLVKWAVRGTPVTYAEIVKRRDRD